jgi:hypothetical protein
MASVADAFADDLEQIRQVRVSSSTTHPSRLFSNSNISSHSSPPSITHGVKGT